MGFLSVLGPLLLMFGFSIALSPLMYIVPILVLGTTFFYFTGDKSRGKKVVNNLMRVGIKTYNFVWMTISIFTLFIGMTVVADFVLEKALPEPAASGSSITSQDYLFDTPSSNFGLDESEEEREERENEERNKAALIGVIITIISAIVLLISIGFNYLIMNEKEKKGTLITKLFASNGLIIYSILAFISLGTFLVNVVEYSFDSEVGINSGPLAMFFISLPIWVGFAAYAYKVLRFETE
jgi:hypothetical protein